MFLLSGTSALGVIYTALGAAVATRYASINALLLPASLVVTVLLLPLLAHLGSHLGPLSPASDRTALTLIRAAYAPASPGELVLGAGGSLAWSAVAFLWARRRVSRLMKSTDASGGR